MRKRRLLLLSIFCISILSACSLRSDAADLYKQENPLQVEIAMPDSIAAQETFTMQAVLTEPTASIEEANFVHFEVWKHDHSIHLPMEEATFLGKGVYEMDFQLEEEGLYYLEVHAGNNGSIVSPRQQFIVGKLSEAELNTLKEGPVKEQESSEKHH
ncbi:FixH family protein [Planococcus sp. CPCC 101016]|uniref:FixH family protein n=1 Tax=Planococcus sp. CPCC 101016 TaxID=2599617 RepID=UPI001646E177|nr:FixH family protein [Planococcus sp. CPCC 101016]